MAQHLVQVFDNPTFGSIRTLDVDGKVLFCGRDVATALGYKDSKNALKQHCKGVAFHHPLETPGGTQQVRFITEGDLYRLIISSKLPTAVKFESWVFDEVLPSIRKHGLYAIDDLLHNDDLLEQALSALKQERLARLAAEQRVLEAAPKVSYYDIVLQSPSLLSVTEIAKDYGISAKRLNAVLREQGVQFKQSGRWFLYAHYAEQGYTQSKTFERNGNTYCHTYWTQKGRLFIYDLLKSLGILPVIEREDGGDHGE